MKISQWGAVSVSLLTLGLVTTADAALASRLGGQAVYDTDLNITWLANTKLAVSQTFGVTGIDGNGLMSWATATSWITAMNASNSGNGYLGIKNWRLPNTLQPDATCGSQFNPGTGLPLQGFGSNCTGSEMGHLFYNELNLTANSSVFGADPVQLAKFNNSIDSSVYWSGTEFASDQTSAWTFSFNVGFQGTDLKTQNLFAWPVRSGDVGLSSVPVPATVWLMGSGLIGLLGVARRKR